MPSPLLASVSARSAVLSLLLGTHPPELSARYLLDVMALFGTAESTTRVALSRMVAAGDLVRTGEGYALSPRLIARQAETDPPPTRVWDKTWEMAVVVATGRSASDRARQRTEMTRRRLAELREGVWMRPANLARPWPAALRAVTIRFEAAPHVDPRELAATLWDLPAWSGRGHALLAALAAAADPPARFLTMVTLVRHLYGDPMLPAELLPGDWPAERLHTAYAEFRADLASMTR